MMLLLLFHFVFPKRVLRVVTASIKAVKGASDLVEDELSKIHWVQSKRSICKKMRRHDFFFSQMSLCSSMEHFRHLQDTYLARDNSDRRTFSNVRVMLLWQANLSSRLLLVPPSRFWMCQFYGTTI